MTPNRRATASDSANNIIVLELDKPAKHFYSYICEERLSHGGSCSSLYIPPMSGVKRSCYSLGTSPKSEPSRVKRRIETPVSSLPQFIHENEGKDTGLACVTVCEENSTSSEERTTPADSDTTPFPLSPLSLGSNDSNSVDETLRAGAWDEKLTCFGTVSLTATYLPALKGTECPL